MRILVGVQGGGLNGIDAYAEQVAQAAVLNGHEVTLLVSDASAARKVASRIDSRVRIWDLGLPEPTRWTTLSQRLWHGVAMRRLQQGVNRYLSKQRESFFIAHLNHPGLAKVFRPWVQRVFVAAWFYPHHPVRRIIETWNHTKGSHARRLFLAAKSFSYYQADKKGYAEADMVVAPTVLLADHLRAQQIKVGVCPPPVQVAATIAKEEKFVKSISEKRVVICAGDLMHPRKNLVEGLQALKELAPNQHCMVEMIGRNAEPLKRMASQLPSGIDVSFPGPLPPQEVHQRMRQADFLLLPSLFEEWGYVAVESLLLGTPVVAYPVYPFQAMLADGLGFIARKRTPSSLAQAMELAWSSPVQENFISIAEHKYGAASVGKRLSQMWTDVAEGKEIRE